MGPRLQHKVHIEWSSDFAYAIGLIASDGYVCKDQRHIQFSSKDWELVENFRRALGLRNAVSLHARGGESEKKYFLITFGDKAFWSYLVSVGIAPRKSRTIQSVAVPEEFFGDFLRGLFDGDGTFYTHHDKRWPNGFEFKTSFASASKAFVLWLRNALARLYGTTGYLHRGAGVYNLEYTKGDSKKIFRAMYHRSGLLFLTRKHDKMQDAFREDERFGVPALQKKRLPR